MRGEGWGVLEDSEGGIYKMAVRRAREKTGTMVARSLYMETVAKGMHVCRRSRTRVNTNIFMRITRGGWGTRG